MLGEWWSIAHIQLTNENRTHSMLSLDVFFWYYGMEREMGRKSKKVNAVEN